MNPDRLREIALHGEGDDLLALEQAKLCCFKPKGENANAIPLGSQAPGARLGVTAEELASLSAPVRTQHGVIQGQIPQPVASDEAMKRKQMKHILLPSLVYP